MPPEDLIDSGEPSGAFRANPVAICGVWSQTGVRSRLGLFDRAGAKPLGASQ
jgi:hypothetical protein